MLGTVGCWVWNAEVLGSRAGKGGLGERPPEIRSPIGQKVTCKNVAKVLREQLFLTWHSGILQERCCSDPHLDSWLTATDAKNRVPLAHRTDPVLVAGPTPR